MNPLSKADIEALISERVCESRTIEYKSQSYNGDADEKREFLADVTAFANSQGGRILIGIAEERDSQNRSLGTPSSAEGVEIDNFEQFKHRLVTWLSDPNACDPPLKTVNIYEVKAFPNGSVVVVDVPKSWLGAHRVSVNKQAYFYLRTSSGKSIMDTREIREAFLLSDSVHERIKHWRAERVGLISIGQEQIELSGHMRAIVHVMPIESFYTRGSINLEVLDQSAMPTLGVFGNPRRNFDGVLTTDNTSLPRYSYGQVFRSGLIEGVCSHLGNALVISGKNWEDRVSKFVASAMHFLIAKELTGPIYVGLSLTGVLGARFNEDEFREHSFDREVLVAPEIEIESPMNCSDVKAARDELNEAITVIWQSAGFSGSQVQQK